MVAICIKNDEFCIEMMGFVFKMMNCVFKMTILMQIPRYPDRDPRYRRANQGRRYGAAGGRFSSILTPFCSTFAQFSHRLAPQEGDSCYRYPHSRPHSTLDHMDQNSTLPGAR